MIYRLVLIICLLSLIASRLCHCGIQNWVSTLQVQNIFREREIIMGVFHASTMALLFTCGKKLVDPLSPVSLSQSSQRKNFISIKASQSEAGQLHQVVETDKYIVNHFNTPAFLRLPTFSSLCFHLTYLEILI